MEGAGETRRLRCSQAWVTIGLYMMSAFADILLSHRWDSRETEHGRAR